MAAPDSGPSGTVSVASVPRAAATISSAGPAGSGRPARIHSTGEVHRRVGNCFRANRLSGSAHCTSSRAISTGTLPALASIASAMRSTSQIR